LVADEGFGRDRRSVLAAEGRAAGNLFDAGFPRISARSLLSEDFLSACVAAFLGHLA